MLDHYAPYLSAPFVQASFEFHGAALEGLTQEEPRAERGAELVSKLMRDDVGRAYVARCFTPETETAARELVRNVVAAWRERLTQVSWMAPATRLAAEHKLDAMLTLVGHTSHWRDYRALDDQARRSRRQRAPRLRGRIRPSARQARPPD